MLKVLAAWLDEKLQTSLHAGQDLAAHFVNVHAGDKDLPNAVFQLTDIASILREHFFLSRGTREST